MLKVLGVLSVLAVLASAAQPSFIDWRATGYNSTIIDQGTCNAGWAAAAVTLYQFEILASAGSSNQQDLSTSYVVDCSGYGGCRNGTLSGAIDFLIANGSYNIGGYSNNNLYSGLSNSSNCTTSSGAIYKTNRTVYKNTYYKVSNLKLRQLLVTAPTANEILVDNTFYSYVGTNTFNCSYYVYSDGDLNSAVVVVGYTKTNNWIVRFYRGLTWGNNGYMILKSGRDCGLRRVVYQINTVKEEWRTIFMSVMLLLALAMGM